MPPVASGRNRRQQILEISTDLFAENGFEGTSMRGIAGACGVTEAAIYRHFESKHDLYEDVIRCKAEQHDIRGHLSRCGGNGSMADVLLKVAEHILTLTAADPGLMRLMCHNSLESGAVAAVLFREIRLPYVEFVAREVRARTATGEVRPVDPLITARCFVGMVMDCAQNLGMWKQIVPFDHEARDEFCSLVPVFARGLQSDAPPAQP